MTYGVREIGLWDGSMALLIDGGEGPRARPPMHLQAANGGYLRLTGPHRPLLWGRVSHDWYAVDCARPPEAPIHVLPMLHADVVDAAPRGAERLGWWTRRFATMLCESACAPLGAGRQHLLLAEQGDWFPPRLREALKEQGERFELDWDRRSFVLLRPYSVEDDGRVKSWRKRARDQTLPPIVVWWCAGFASHVLLDGHDRLQAALLEGLAPDVIVLADVVPHSMRDTEAQRREALELAARLAAIGDTPARARAMNSVLGKVWDPRREWDHATPGFPLDIAAWTWETRDRL